MMKKQENKNKKNYILKNNLVLIINFIIRLTKYIIKKIIYKFIKNKILLIW
jgi:hypothetical protein